MCVMHAVLTYHNVLRDFQFTAFINVTCRSFLTGILAHTAEPIPMAIYHIRTLFSEVYTSMHS